MPFCPHCGNEVSPLAAACPRCGRPLTGLAEVAVVTGPPPLRLAGFWIRLAAFVVDGIILALATALVVRVGRLPAVLYSDCPGVSLVCGPEPLGGLHVDQAALAARQLAGIIVMLAYTGTLLAVNDGRTVGGLLAGIRVARPSGERISAPQAFGRQAFSVLSRIPLYLGFLWVAWDPEKRTWHDMVAGTRVFTTR